MDNLNPVASGSKTTSGVASLVMTVLGMIIAAALKKYGFIDADGQITANTISLVMGGGLTVWGAIHKWIKSRKK
jgi:hypothetical protein